jgi:hypothetical protein
MKTFSSVAQMKLAFLTAGQLVETSGYYTAGDGGQARYLVKANEAVDNLGNHDLAGTTVAVLQNTGSVNVKQFGAKGDGVTEDAASFNAAETASNPAIVVVPVASYKITGTVTGSFYSFGIVTIVTGAVNTITNTGDVVSTTVAGVVELATQAEVDAGIDTTRVITPATLSALAGLLIETTGTFVANWTGFLAPLSSTWTYIKRGNIVTIHVPQVGAESNASTFTSGATELPAAIRPITSKMGAFITRNNGTFISGTIDVSSGGQISFGSATLSGLGGFSLTGDKGFRGNQSFTYTLD